MPAMILQPNTGYKGRSGTYATETGLLEQADRYRQTFKPCEDMAVNLHLAMRVRHASPGRPVPANADALTVSSGKGQTRRMAVMLTWDN